MVDYGYIALRNYPKSEKFTLAQDTRHALWNLGTLMQQACDVRNTRKKISLMDAADKELIRLKLLVRAGKRLGFLPFKKYEIWSGFLVEIGKMIGGWMKSITR